MKKAIKSLCLSLICCMFLFTSLNAKADSIITVKDVSTDTVSISWTAKSDLTTGKLSHYYVGIGTSEERATENCTTELAADVTSYTFENLEAGVAYSIVLKYSVTPNNAKAGTKDTICDYAKAVAVTAPNKPSNVRQTYWSAAYNKLTIEWDQAGQCAGFEYQYEDADGDSVKKTTTEKKVDIATAYTDYAKFKVRAFIEFNNSKKYSEWTSVFTAFAQPIIKETEDGYAVTVKGGKMHIQWDKVSQAKGYEIYVGAKRNGTFKKVKTIKNKGTTKATLKKFNGKKFSPKKDYYVYVVGYRKTNAGTSYTSSNYMVYYHKGETYLTFKKAQAKED